MIKARKVKRLYEGGALWHSFESLLKKFNSPEQIASILERMNPDDSPLQLSHETIYTAIYATARGKGRRGKIPNRVSIHEGPAEIEDSRSLGKRLN